VTDRDTTTPGHAQATPTPPPWYQPPEGVVPPPRATEEPVAPAAAPPAAPGWAAPPQQAPYVAPRPAPQGGRKQAPWVPAQQPSAPPQQPQWGPPQQLPPWAAAAPAPAPGPQAQTLVQPAVPAGAPQAAPAPGRPTPWGPPPAPGAPGTHRKSKGPGAVVWAAVGALLAAVVVIAAVVFGDDLFNGTEAADSAAPAPSVAQDETVTETLPEPDTDSAPPLPSLGEEEPDPSIEPVQPAPLAGDLGLAVAMSSPACDGTWVVFLGATTDPASYPADVQTILDSNPGAQYTITQGGCSSMRQQLPDGTKIYAVWTGPYADQAQACAARAGFGEGAYVKRMDNSTPPEQLWEC
jgi:hypothetical protein